MEVMMLVWFNVQVLE